MTQEEPWRDTPLEILAQLKHAEVAVEALAVIGKKVGFNGKFTLDGRLVGDVGELIVASFFDIVRNRKPKGHVHDLFAKIGDREVGVQVKLRRESKKGKMTFKNRPDLLLVIELSRDWSKWRIVFHGEGTVITDLCPNHEVIGETRLRDSVTKESYLGVTLDQLRAAHASSGHRGLQMPESARTDFN